MNKCLDQILGSLHAFDNIFCQRISRRVLAGMANCSTVKYPPFHAFQRFLKLMNSHLSNVAKDNIRGTYSRRYLKFDGRRDSETDRSWSSIQRSGNTNPQRTERVNTLWRIRKGILSISTEEEVSAFPVLANYP
jgi:hypothetical protein